MQHVSIKLPPAWIDKLKKRAKDHGHNKSSYVRWLIEKDLEKEKTMEAKERYEAKKIKSNWCVWDNKINGWVAILEKDMAIQAAKLMNDEERGKK